MFKYGMSIIAAAALLNGAVPAPVGEWSFDNSTNLTAAKIGQALTLTGSHQAISGPTSSDGAVRIGVGSHYTVTTGTAANGGGKFVNEYTLSFDFRVPTTAAWASFFQTNTTNGNDAECFVRKDAGTLGVSATGYSSKAILPNTWYRMSVSVDNGSFYRIYLDGVKILEGTKQSVDGRFAIESTFKLFADENGEDGIIDIAQARFWNSAFTDAQVSELGGFATAPTGDFLTGPYLQNADTAGITVMWESKSSSVGTVRYGLDQTTSSSVASTVFNPSTGTYIHTARINGLTADASYFWKVQTASGTSAVKTFRTSPKSYARSFRIGLWGDSHHTSPWAGMASYMVDSLKVDLAVATGDISNTGNTYSDLTPVFLPYVCNTIGSKVPFYASLGNHDVGSSWGGGDLIRRFLDQPKGINSDASGFRGSYLTMYGNAAIISIDWNRYGTDLLPGAWLEQTLSSARVKNAALRIILIHCAPFYERWQTAEQSVVKTNIPLLAEKYGVQMVFSGHMHGYERGFKNGVFYVTQGGGSYMDVSEPVGPTLYSHITVGTNKPGNMPGFNNGLVNHILTIDVTDSSAWVKLRYFDKAAKYLGVYDSFTVALKRDTVIADTGTMSPNAPIYAWTLEGNGKEFKNRIAEPNMTGISYESNGVQGQAAKFNSSFMNLGYGSAATFGLPAKEMTVSCWVKASSFQTWGGLIGHIQDNGTYEKGWILGTSSNKFSFALKGTGSSAMTYLEAGTTASTNQWYHVVATYNGSAMKLYVNGTLAGSSTIQSGNIEYAPSSWFQLGAYKDDDENFVHQGSLDDVALWNRVLTDSEIAALASKQPIADLFTAIRADQVSVTESMNSSIRSIQVGSIANGVSLSLPEEGEIKLFQISGREVFQSRLQRGTNSLDLTALSTGVYLMSIRTVSGIVLNQKFVK